MSGLSAWLMAYPILLERIKSNMGAAIGILVCDKSSGHRPLLAELGRPGRSTRRPSADKVARHSETLGVDDRDVQLHEHIAQGTDLFMKPLLEIAGVAVALDAPQDGTPDGLSNGRLAAAAEAGGPRFVADDMSDAEGRE